MEQADLDKVILENFEAVFNSIRDDDALRVGLLSYYAVLKINEFKRTGRMEDLEEAVDKAEQVVEATPEGHPDLAGRLNNLGNMLENRFERTGRMEDLEEAIRKAEQAMEATPERHPDLAAMLNNLGSKLGSRFERTGRMEDLEEAIRKAEQAVEATPEGHPDLAGRLNNLGNMLESRFERTGRMEDLEEAIREAEQAVEATPEGHPDLAAMLNNLGNKLGSRFKRTGRMKDLEEAIRKAEQAVEATPGGHPDLAAMLNNLGNKLESRFERTGRMEDLEEAIRKAEQAVEATPEGHPDLAGRLNNLGNMLESRFERTGRMEDLEEAIRKAEQAVEATPEEHPDLAAMLNNLGNKLGSRFKRTGRMEDLEEAIRKAEQAVEVTPERHPDLAGRLNNLGNKLGSRFERTGRMEDLEEAIRKAEQAVEATPEGHPDLAGWLNNLGRHLSLSSEPFHRDRALESFLKSWECQNGIPFHRVASALQAIRLLQKQGDWYQASAIAKQAVSILPIVSNRYLNRDDQQHAVSKFSGLAANACSLSLKAGDSVVQALELLELGRGVILGYLIDGRSDLSELEASCPEKAATYDRLRIEVNAPIQEMEELNMRQDLVKRRMAAVRELEDCLRDIRQQPGHERFLLGPTLEELKKCAVEGPIVVINVTDIRSDAIIVSKSAIKAIELPELMVSQAEEWIQQGLTRYKTPEEYGKKNKRYREFLGWLWSKCVTRVIEELEGGAKPALHNLPRIWWIGVGIASFLPFHAAGDHSAGSTENTFSRAISSYSPTIKALTYARERVLTAKRFNSDKPNLLIVTMSTTPGERPLPGVIKEMSEVQMVVKPAFSVQSLNQPNAKKVLDQLKQCDLVHFACHGVSDITDPSNSYLMLQDCQDLQSTLKLDKLTVRQISGVSLQQARIAYLSACSTAESRTVQLADEVIHLASGFQVAGFGHVIGSMWSSKDSICVEVAKRFYEQLRTSSGIRSNRAVAKALHDSVMNVRSGLRKQPLDWAQYVHLGA